MNSNVDLVQNHTNFKAVEHAVYNENDVAQYIFLICWEDITQIYSVTNGLTYKKTPIIFSSHCLRTGVIRGRQEIVSIILIFVTSSLIMFVTHYVINVMFRVGLCLVQFSRIAIVIEVMCFSFILLLSFWTLTLLFQKMGCYNLVLKE